MRVRYWGSELAEVGDCAFCGKNAVDEEDSMAFLLPVEQRRTEFYEGAPEVVDWTSKTYAVACRSCYEAAIRKLESNVSQR
jgi:hypothetical protein